MVSKALNTTVILLQRIEVDGINLPVACAGFDRLYVGLSGGISLITEEGVTQQVIFTEGMVCSIHIVNELFYTLSHSCVDSTWSVRVYDSTFIVREWKHIDIKEQSLNQLAIVEGNVFIPDRINKLIVRYSTSGKVIGRMFHSTLTDGPVRLCAMSHIPSLVLVNGSTVSRLDASMGCHCVWANDCMDESTAVCCGAGDRVYVVIGRWCTNPMVAVLDGQTGEWSSYIRSPDEWMVSSGRSFIVLTSLFYTKILNTLTPNNSLNIVHCSAHVL